MACTRLDSLSTPTIDFHSVLLGIRLPEEWGGGTSDLRSMLLYNHGRCTGD